MNTPGTLALELLKLYGCDSPVFTRRQRAAITLALAVCKVERLYPGPGPWLREHEEIGLPPETTPPPEHREPAPWVEGFDAMAKKGDAPVSTERSIFRQSKDSLWCCDQRKVIRWETYRARQVIEVKYGEPSERMRELEAELDRLAPLDPRD